MVCKHLLCAQSIIADSRTKRISVINLLENGNLNTFPTLIPIMVYVAIEKETSDIDEGLHAILKVKYNNVSLSETVIEVKASITKSITTIGIPIAEPGELTFSIFLGDQELRKEVIKFKAIPKPTPTEISSTIATG